MKTAFLVDGGFFIRRYRFIKGFETSDSPPAKFARKEGVDFILDPMLNHIDSTLHEHIDGLMTIKNMSRADEI